ncbi:MAG: UDP-N-acetylmuramyl-tripeptide synthetase, partial [Actinobacteria bacterium]|nr:UDP-N-acetylmuramyl-tripeptide synthetase [Actinomycetota bacterium]
MSTTLAAAAGDLERVFDARALARRGDAEVIDLSHDSRQIRPGWLFCAVRGAAADGHRFAPSVADRAAAVMVERWLDLDLPQLRVPDVRRAMGPVAAHLHGAPSQHLRVVGVTGTNGKTTVTYLLEAIFGAAAMGTGVIGTVGARIHGAPEPGMHTTPEAPDLQRLLARMRVRGVDAVAMEVSSHGLQQHRVDGTRFATVVFTNLTHDHLDFHGDMHDYYDAKARLFTRWFAEQGIVCVDDEWGRRLRGDASVAVVTYGRASDADVEVCDVIADLQGTTWTLRTSGASRHGAVDGARLHTRLLGAHNALNGTAALLAALDCGVGVDAATAGLAACEGVPGRLQPVTAGQPFAVLVDYAHTPDALEVVLAAARDLAGAGGRVRVVVGRGDRGQGPRERPGGRRRPRAVRRPRRRRRGARAARVERVVIALTLAEVADVTGGALHATGATAHDIVDRVATDSREAGPGALFIAIRGEHHDGHDHIAAALAAGAGGVLAALPSAHASDDQRVVTVGDTVAALADLARHVRDRVDPAVVAITGSVGKTTTKDLIAAAVGSTRTTVAAPASFNNELGVPLTCLAIDASTEVLVVEVGSRGVGHIRSLMPLVQPDIAVVTAVAGAHLEQFGDIATVARAKGELVEGLGDGGVAVLNADDARVIAMAERTAARIISYGRG